MISSMLLKATFKQFFFCQGLYMIRFHSFYPWHSNGDYMHLCNEKDLQMLPWVKEFKYVMSFSMRARLCVRLICCVTHILKVWPLTDQKHASVCLSSDSKFDLYTKSTELPDVESLRPYYQSLIDKYCPGILRWWTCSRILPICPISNMNDTSNHV